MLILHCTALKNLNVIGKFTLWQTQYSLENCIKFNLVPYLSWLYGSYIYNYLCNQCLSARKLWVWIPLIARCSQYSIMWLSLSVTWGRSLVFSVFSGFLHNKTDCHDITEILLKWHSMNAITPYMYQNILGCL